MNSSIYKQSFCALDIETTGVNPFTDKIIEIGIVKFSIDKGEVESYETLINPGIPVSHQSHLIHNITEEDLTDKPAYHEVYDLIRDTIKDTYLVIQNPQFDLSFLQSENRSADLPIFTNYSFDTVILAKKVFKGLKNHKLETVSRHLNCVRNFHRALDDAFCCMDIFVEGVKRIDPAHLFTVSDLSGVCGFNTEEKILRVMHNYKWKGVTLEPGFEYIIKYSDKAGSVTERKILTKNLFKNGSTLFLHAFCHLRNEERFFKLARIRNITLC
ncbi:MAG: exonuclease domain-containing protein [Spirochaetes bacterium]|nr:exonuclease domain-containing protein [Spirochaetota bacterium]